MHAKTKKEIERDFKAGLIPVLLELWRLGDGQAVVALVFEIC